MFVTSKAAAHRLAAGLPGVSQYTFPYDVSANARVGLIQWAHEQGLGSEATVQNGKLCAPGPAPSPFEERAYRNGNGDHHGIVIFSTPQICSLRITVFKNINV